MRVLKNGSFYSISSKLFVGSQLSMLSALLMLGVFLIGSPAAARQVKLNGVGIAAVTNQKFENCTVAIDAYGNIDIVAPQYSAKGTEVPVLKTALPSAGGPPVNKYFIITEKSAPGMTQYEVDLFINAKWVRKFYDLEERIVLDVTKYLRAGPNKITFVAKKNIEGTRRSEKQSEYFRMMLGEGKVGGHNVVITRQLVDFRKTAADMTNAREQRTFIAQ